MTFLTALAAGALLLPVVAFGAAQAPSDDLVPATVVSQASSPSTPALNTIAPEAVTRSETEVEQTPIGRWAWPLTPLPQVVRRFAVGPAPWSPGHRGVDLAPKSESLATVRAPANGVVHFAGMLAGRPVLSIAHGDGLISSFEPVVSTLRRGQVVHRDDVVGRLTNTQSHCSGAKCLHWGVRKSRRYIDPLLLVQARRGPAVLLPLLPR